MAFGVGVGDVGWGESFAGCVEEATDIPVLFLMKRIGCVVAGPVKPAIIVPNRHNIFFPSRNRLRFPKDLPHKYHKVLSRVTVNRIDSLTLLHRELLHNPLDNTIRIIVKLLEIMPEISHNMIALEDALKKFVLAVHVPDVGGFRLTEGLLRVA